MVQRQVLYLGEINGTQKAARPAKTSGVSSPIARCHLREPERDVVLVPAGIRINRDQPLDARLRDDQPVEEIFIEGWKPSGLDSKSVVDRNLSYSPPCPKK